MNKLIKLITSIAIIAVLLLTLSCSFSKQDESGRLVLPSPRAAMPEVNTIIRYSLERNDSPVKMNGQDVITVDHTNSVEIENLNPGSGYKLLVSYGYKDGNNFKVTHLKTSDSFSIMAGTATEVNILLDAAPDYTFLTTSGAQSSAVYINETLYLLDGTEVFRITSNGKTEETGIPEDVIITSLSRGLTFDEDFAISEELWLNTNQGLYHPNSAGDGYEKNMPTNLSPAIKFSKAVEIKDTSGPAPVSFIVAVYSGGGSSLGLIFAESQTDFTAESTEDNNTWETLDSIDSEEADEILKNIKGDIILDFAINDSSDSLENIYYLVTPLGTIIGSADIADIGEDTDFVNLILGSDNSLKIGDGSQSIRRVSSAGNSVYVAPDKGVYVANISKIAGSRGKPTEGGFTLVSGTANRKIIQLSSIEYKNPENGDDVSTYTAAVTEKNAVLIIKDGALLAEIPATAGMPNKAEPYFYDDGSLQLILSGTNGSVQYTVVE